MADSAELKNELNFMAWKRDHANRRQQLRTQFNIWRTHQQDRLCNHQEYKSSSNEQTDQLKEMLQQRLEQACSCNTCQNESTEFRRLSLSSSSDEHRRTSLGDTDGQPLRAGSTDVTSQTS